MNRPQAQRILLLSWLLLLAVLLIWWLASINWPPQVSALSGALLLLPLAGVLPAILRGSQKVTAAASMLLIPYVGWGLTEAIANPDSRLFAAATVFTGTVSFAALILWLRVLRSA